MDFKFENLEKIDEILKLLLEQKKTSTIKRWLNITETAYYLGYSKEYIHKLKDSSFFINKHYYKKSGKLLFDKYELDIWVTSSINTINSKELAKEVLKDLI
jgi:hypothetical protein